MAYTREQIGQALKAAHEAGDVEAARTLAIAYRDWKPATPDPVMNRASERANMAFRANEKIAPSDLAQLGRPDFSGAAMSRLPAPTMRPEELDAFDAQRAAEKERLRVPDSNLKERLVIGSNIGTFGHGPQAMAGASTVGALLVTPFLKDDIIDREGVSGAMSSFLDDAKVHQSRARTERPIESFGTEIVGGLLQGKTFIDTLGRKFLPKTNTVSNVGRVVGTGTGYGTLYGLGQSESDTLQGALGDAAYGGATGAAFGLGFKAAEPALTAGYRSAKTGAATISDALSDLLGKAGGARDKVAQEVALAAVRRSMERSGMTFDQVMDLVKRYEGKPAVLAEVIGQDAVNSLTALTRRPGSTPQKAQDLIEERFYGRPDRMKGDVEDATGIPIGQLDEMLATQLEARQETAKPLYDALYKQFNKIDAFRQPGQTGQVMKRLNRLGRTPLAKRHLQTAKDAVATIAGRRSIAISKMSTMEYWDLVKRSLDNAIDSAQKRGEGSTRVGEDLKDLVGLKDDLVSELDRLTDGAYATVRQAGGEAPRLKAAAVAGQKALQARNPRDVAKTVAATLAQDLPALRAGIVEDLGTRIDKGMTPGRVRVPDVAGKLRAGLGDESANKLINRFDAEATLSETGSRWAPRMNSVTGTVMESGATQMGDDLINAGMNLATGNKVDFARKVINLIRQRGFSQRQIDAIGDLLLSSPEEGLKRLRMMAPDGAPTNAFAPAAGAADGALNSTAQGGTPTPNAFAQKPGKLGTRTADAAAIATLGLQGGTAEADTGEVSAELKTANDRVIGIEAQISELDDETIPTLEEQIRLLQDYKADPREKQRILIARGHDLGTFGPNKDGVDGDLRRGSYSAKAVISEVAKIEADIARRRQEREGYKSDLATARGEVDKIQVRLAEQGGKPATPFRDKVLEAASYGAGIYLAHRVRKGGLNAAQKNATAIESKANALLSRRPPVPPVPDRTALGSIPLVGQPIEKALFPNKVAQNTSATDAAARAAQAAEPRLSGNDVPPISPDPTSPDGLPTRVANLNKYYLDGGAERQLPVEDLGNGQFAMRSDVMPDYRLYGPKGPIGRFVEPVTSRFRTGDVAVTAGGALDYTVMTGMVEQTRIDIKTAEEELKAARAANGGLGNAIRIDAAKEDIEKLKTIESVQVGFQRLGLGMMGFGLLGGMHGKYARPQPRHEAAIRERNLIAQAISPAPIAPPPAPVVPPPSATVNAFASPPPAPKKPRTASKPKPTWSGPKASVRTKKPANDNDR